jgi:hypothetical protein
VTSHGGGPFAAGPPGVNLAYTKFLFVTPSRDEETARARLRAAGSIAARGFFNDFDAEAREAPPHETIQFLVRADPVAAHLPPDRLRQGYGGSAEALRATAEGGSREAAGAGAPYALQVSSKYRPRLDETDAELRRRVGEFAEVSALEGAVRVPQYTSAAMHAYANLPAMARASGRVQRNAIVIPMRKSKEWWDKPALERQVYFYPHADVLGTRVKGHARAAEPGISTIFRKLYYNPEGPGREGEWDFITYFECADDQLATFDEVCRALRDQTQNPEWRYVTEGPEWRGRRVLRW